LKKILLLVLLFFNLLQGSDADVIESKIVMNMLQAISNNSRVSIHTDSKRIKAILKNDKVEFLNTCEDADVIILEKNKNKNLCKNTPVLTLKYDLLKVYPNSVASFFWQKGRPNIVFIEPRLKEQKIVISGEFQDFIEENIW